MTLAGSIKTVLYDNWNLSGDLAKAKIRFSETGWFDATYASYPQIVVSELAEPIGGYYGGSYQTYPRFLVNLWLQIPRGAKGTAEAQNIEDMRYEVLEIIQSKKNDVATFRPLVPIDVGTPRHELDRDPRMLRYEITLLGAHTKP